MEPFVIYLLVGIVVVLIGLGTIRKGSRKDSRCTASTSAVIVEVQQSKEDESYTYTPIYEFTVGKTTVRKSGGKYSYNKKEFRVGESAAIRYNPEKPEEFIADGANGAKGAGVVLLLFGLVMIVIAFTQR